jgi:hypothetical protein
MYKYILISTHNSYKHKIAHEVSLIDEVIDVEPLLTDESSIADPFFEDYNLIAKIEVNEPDGAEKIVHEKISKLEGFVKSKIISKK